MIKIVQDIIKFYLTNSREPALNELEIIDKSIFEKKWCVFVTIYKNWEIRGSAWNIKELEPSIAQELIKSTIDAISKDIRFKPLSLNESIDVKIRIDIIDEKRMLTQPGEIKSIDPVKFWIIAIKKDYEDLAIILPNINNTLLHWEDFIGILKAKLADKDFKEDNYILYEIKTSTITSY